MNRNPKIERVLVLLSDDMLDGDARNTPLLRRALTFAQATGCELELFHLCRDLSLEQKLRVSDVAQARQSMADRDATRVAELALALAADDVTVRHDVRWDHPRVDAVLRKIGQSKADLVMKRSAEHSYLLGMFGNTDWDLLRRSPVPVWFVNETLPAIDRLVTGIASVAGDDDVVAAADYHVLRMARLLTEAIGAENFPVHAYQVPGHLTTYASYAPAWRADADVVASMPTRQQARLRVRREHGGSVRALAATFQLDPDNVRIEEGKAGDVLPSAARALSAGLIVMGAHNLSRWKRLFSAVTAEPVLADARCDVLFVKRRDQSPSIPDADREPRHVTPPFNLEQAVLEPRRTFGTPRAIAAAEHLSTAMRLRLLQIWDQDLRAQLAEENEGGVVKSPNTNVLAEIAAATRALRDANGAGPARRPASAAH